MAKSSVFVQLDGYGALDMTLAMNGNASTNIETNPSATQNVAELSSIESSSATEESVTTTITETASSTPTDEPLGKEEDPSTTSEEIVSSELPILSLEEYSSSEIPAPSDEGFVAFTAAAPQVGGIKAAARPIRPNGFHKINRRHMRRDNQLKYSGCVDIDMGVAIVAGADGKLLSFWKESAKWDLFRHEWDVYTVSKIHPLLQP